MSLVWGAPSFSSVPSPGLLHAGGVPSAAPAARGEEQGSGEPAGVALSAWCYYCLPAQAVFAVVVAGTALAETLLATGLSAWLLLRVGPSLNHCSHEPAALSQCKCSTGFVDPPSLVRHVQFYEAVDDCAGLGPRLLALHYLLTTLYCVGVVLSVATVAAASKQLHSLGLCGKSGIYTVSSTVLSCVHCLKPPPLPRSPPSLPPPSHASHPSPLPTPPSMPPTAS